MRAVFSLLSAAVVLALFVGLNQAEARAIYHPYDKWLHASVFFLLWWLARLSLPGPVWWVTALVVGLGGAEELRQAFTPGRTADWADMVANTTGASAAAVLYGAMRALWAERHGLAHAQHCFAQVGTPGQTQPAHRVDWRLELRLWHWRWYLVVLAGSSRRALSREQTVVTGRVLAVLLAGVLLVAATLGTAVLLLIAVSLGL